MTFVPGNPPPGHRGLPTADRSARVSSMASSDFSRVPASACLSRPESATFIAGRGFSRAFPRGSSRYSPLSATWSCGPLPGTSESISSTQKIPFAQHCLPSACQLCDQQCWATSHTVCPPLASRGRTSAPVRQTHCRQPRKQRSSSELPAVNVQPPCIARFVHHGGISVTHLMSSLLCAVRIPAETPRSRLAR
jgi:hypothetical protein